MHTGPWERKPFGVQATLLRSTGQHIPPAIVLNFLLISKEGAVSGKLLGCNLDPYHVSQFLLLDQKVAWEIRAPFVFSAVQMFSCRAENTLVLPTNSQRSHSFHVSVTFTFTPFTAFLPSYFCRRAACCLGRGLTRPTRSTWTSYSQEDWTSARFSETSRCMRVNISQRTQGTTTTITLHVLHQGANSFHFVHTNCFGVNVGPTPKIYPSPKI